MKFAKIIQAAEIENKNYPRLSEFEVEVFDRKNRKIEDVNFDKPIFSENVESFYRFKHFLNENESNSKLTSIQVKYDASFLILYKNCISPVVLMRY